MSALARCRREGIGQIFTGAAEIEQQIDADIVAEQGRQADHGTFALLIAAAAAAPRERRIDLVEDLHQHARHRHQDEIAIDDVAELMCHHGALLVLAQELEDALRDHDACVGSQEAVGEGGGVPVGNEADPRRGEPVLVSHLVDELMHARIARFHRSVVEKLELVEPS